MAKDLLSDSAEDLGRDFGPPPPFVLLATAAGLPAFRVAGDHVDLWFQRRSDVLMVTFDNLASVGQYDPPQPWLHGRCAAEGVSILGLMAKRKDWYRNPDAAAHLAALAQAGFFKGFRRVIFAGASMGGFAALTLAPLVPGAVVLAFSPQSTLARARVPFDKRYRYAQKAWDWQSPAHLDAAEADLGEVWLAYDPFVAEDKAHAARIKARDLRQFHLDHMGHRAIRMMRTGDALQVLLRQVISGAPDPAALARALRGRRQDLQWQRALMAAAEARGHVALVRQTARRILRDDPTSPYAQRLLSRFGAEDSLRSVAPSSGPFHGHIQTLHQALVLPERPTDRPLAAGVLDRNGAYAPLSRGWIRAGKPFLEPHLTAGEPATDLPGRHLYAGHFRAHFGHFLVESTARLWALDHVRADGILFLPYRGDPAPLSRDEAPAEFFRLLGIDVPIRALPDALRVEELHIPELGFGWEERYAGSPAFHRFMRDRLAHIAPEGGEKLYISRARLNAQRGGVLGETVIEENLSRLGFDIFHPERHPLRTQIARYKAARQIVALDGSALHLAAFVLHPEAQVAMILRRSRANAADYLRQFKGFCGIDLKVIDVIARDWVAGGANRSDYRSVGELDFSALFGWLKGLSMIPPDFRPMLPSRQALDAMLEAYADKRGAPFRALTPGEAHPESDLASTH